MIIQPAVEVNSVVNASSPQANRWGSDSRQQRFPDAEIGRRLRTAQTANRENIKSLRGLILAHRPDRTNNRQALKTLNHAVRE